MSPDYQIVSQVTESMQAFRELGIGLAVLFVAGLFAIAIIIFLVTNYRLRSTLANRDMARAAVDNDASTRQDDIATKLITMFGSFTEAIRDVKEDMAAAMFASNQAQDRSTEVQKQTNELTATLILTIKALDARAGDNQKFIVDHDQTARTGIKDIVAAIERVERKVDDALKGIGEIKAFYPEGTDRMARVEKELAEAIEELKDCAKKATDENPVTRTDIAPMEPEPETLTRQEPGTGEEKAA